MRTQTYFRRTLAALAVASALGVSAAAMAQETTGRIEGAVTTTESTQVAGATVTIRNVNTGFTRSVQVDGQGNYSFGQLPTGVYSLTVEKAGYQTQSTESIRVAAGGTVSVSVPLYSNVERISVVGSTISAVDTRSSGTSLNIGELELDRIPVPRTATDVALLAPSTTKGDSRFGNLASFGGASVAENATYINGLNVTNFRNGLGFSNVPFEFYKEFQILTGGYGAEFGRSTGGVINALTKSGSNDFEAGANVYFQPKSLRETSPNAYYRDGRYYVFNEADEYTSMQANLYVSGALIQDKLFYYVMYNPRDIDSETVGSEGETYINDETGDDFWGAKIDWQITNDHLLEVLAFSDSQTTNTTSYGYVPGVGVDTSEPPGKSYAESGGDNWSVTYTGYLTDDLTVKALYGVNEYSLSSNSSEFAYCTLIRDMRADKPNGLEAGCADATTYFGELGEDERKAMRVDFEWRLTDDHTLRFGYDQETNTSISETSYSGPEGAYYFIYDAQPGDLLANGASVPAGATGYARQRAYRVSGNFETKASALYVEDTWSITPDVTATIGLRQETFDNMNADGQTFVKIDDMLAPRLGLAWDINGDGQSKFFANLGRYFLPVANNTNVRLSGNEYDVSTYYVLNGASVGQIEGQTSLILDLGSQIGQQNVNSDGSVPDTRSIVDQDIDPMYQDELIIGYEAQIDDSWSWGVRGIRRELNGAIDDMIVDHALNARYNCDVYHQSVLGNPGEDMSIWADTNCDGDVDELITLSGAELLYPQAERKYSAVELTLARAWDDQWSLNASYTWSKSYGNSEGLVKSDIAQGDAGITQDFDFPELMDGAYGALPNDRRHTFKAYGAYQLSDSFRLGANFNLSSGRPLNAFGIGHPNGVPEYGDTYYVCVADCADDALDNAPNVYNKFERGTYGRTEWAAQLDLNATYETKISEFDVIVQLDVFNVLNASAVTRRNEFAETGSPGTPNDRFMLPSSYQTPRYVQLSAGFKF